jgi:hypothetical protein
MSPYYATELYVSELNDAYTTRMVEKATSFLGENDHRGRGDEREDL